MQRKADRRLARRTTGRTIRGTMMLMLVSFASLLAGCISGGDGLVPPRADVSGIHAVAVFPFENDTGQRDLEETFVDHLTSGLQAVGWYEVVPAEQLAAAMVQRRDFGDQDMDNVVWLDTAREIAVELGADGFIVGRFADYSDEVTIGTPYNATTASPPEWRVDQTTRADVTLEVRLIDVHTGTVVYERRAEGSGRIDDTRLLNWSSPSSPPDALIPTPHRRDVRHAREQAIQHAFAAFAEDILPQRQGVPADDGDITDHEDLTDHEDINGGVSDAHI